MQFDRFITNTKEADEEFILSMLQRLVDQHPFLKERNSKVVKKEKGYAVVSRLGIKSKVESKLEIDKKIKEALVDLYNLVVLHKSIDRWKGKYYLD